MDMKEYIKRLHLSTTEQELANQFLEQAESNRLVVGLFGSFSVGKSHLINQLLERDGLLPTHTNETTAIVTHIVYGFEEGVDIFFKDGRVNHLPLEGLEQFIVGGKVDEVEKILVTLSQPAWLKKVEIIDTPGRNTKYKAHIEATKQAIIQADAAIYVLPWQGLTLEDIVYLKELIIYQPNLFFVLNKVDRIEEQQGQTIEDVRMEVERELEKELGIGVQVYALSAKTGFNLEQFTEELIPQLTEDIQRVKKQRLHTALHAFLGKIEKRITNDLNIVKAAEHGDQQAFDDDIRKIEVEQTKVQGYVQKQLTLTKKSLNSIKTDTSRNLHHTMRQLKNQLVHKLTEDRNVAELNKVIENELLSARNIIYKDVKQRLNSIEKEQTFTLSELAPLHASVQIQEPNLSDLQANYMERLQQINTEYESKKQRLDSYLNGDTHRVSEEEINVLHKEMEILEDELLQEYIPKYIMDENYDPDKATKVLKTIGFVGDIAVSVALAAVTAGASAGAQVAGKAGAKAGTKAATKAATKTGTKVVSKKMLKDSTKIAIKASVRAGLETVDKKIALKANQTGTDEKSTEEKKNSASLPVTTLKLIDQVTSPVETIATNIGRAIDKSRQPDQKIDALHRQQFFLKKTELEKRFDAKKQELHKLKDAQQNNQTIVANIELKLQDIDKQKHDQLTQLEKAVQQDKEQMQAKHFKESIENQLTEILAEERTNYLNWIEHEFDQIYTVIESTLPKYYEKELEEWKTQISAVKEQFAGKSNALEERKAILQADLVLCTQMKESLGHDS